MNYWESSEYHERLSKEWFACGMINPKAYKTRDEWVEALAYEREVKNFIYKLRSDDAQENKYYDKRNGIFKYNSGYEPLSWDKIQAKAFRKFGKRKIHYIYDPLATPNIDEYYFDFRVADTWCDWIEAHMCHVEGKLGNQLILLSLEQRNFYRNIFGWKRKEDNLRRYSEIFKYIPRKNSKSFDLACMALGTMALDQEFGCKVVAVASNEKQAHEAFKPAKAIIEKDEELKTSSGLLADYFNTYTKSITTKDDTDSFIPLPFKEKSAHGGNFHLSILDEVHVMPDSSMYNVCVTSQGSRTQPMIAMITTAGTFESVFCNTKLDYAKSICKGDILDDEFFPVLYYACAKDFNDDWHDKQVWIRTNPMYGLGKEERHFDRMHKKTINDHIFENDFKRLDINMTTSSMSQAYNMIKWNNCKQNVNQIAHQTIRKQKVPDFLIGKKCNAALDLASKNDLCALTLDFFETGWIISWGWLPDKKRANIKNCDAFKNVLNICGVEIIDFKILREDICDILDFFNVVNLGYDPRFATELIQRIDEHLGLTDFTFEINQSSANLNEATRNSISLVKNEDVKHNGCPLFTWQVNNAQAVENSSGHKTLRKPSSKASNKKIDAASAMVMCRVLYIHGGKEETFEDRKQKEGQYFV